jgi:CBS domain-containing protein
MEVAKIMTRDPLSVAPSDSLNTALGLLEAHDIRHLPVVEQGRVVGVISDRDLLESTGWMWDEERGKPPVTVADVLQPDPMAVAAEDEVAALARKLVEWTVGCAPVVRAGELVGIVTEIDVLKAFLRDTEHVFPPVEEHMSVELVTLELDATAEEAIDLARGERIRHLPVVDGDSVVGMVSDRDLRAVLGRALPANTPVREFMSTEVTTLEPEDTLDQAARLMIEHKIGGIPVVSREGLVGIITATDVLDHCAESLD